MTNKDLSKENLGVDTEEKLEVKEVLEEITEVNEEKVVEEVSLEENEEITDEALESNIIEETEEVEEEKSEEVEEEDVAKEGTVYRLFKKVLAALVDQIISLGLALLLLLATNFLLPLVGFQIVEKEPMFLIIYVLVNILYGPICSSTKLKDTVGRKILL
ncbi:MAG: hypothetical protein IJO26_00685 [Clostridium sp.]|nr:hypothetical protein [Clostridium sp.]